MKIKVEKKTKKKVKITKRETVKLYLAESWLGAYQSVHKATNSIIMYMKVYVCMYYIYYIRWLVFHIAPVFLRSICTIYIRMMYAHKKIQNSKISINFGKRKKKNSNNAF